MDSKLTFSVINVYSHAWHDLTGLSHSDVVDTTSDYINIIKKITQKYGTKYKIYAKIKHPTKNCKLICRMVIESKLRISQNNDEQKLIVYEASFPKEISALDPYYFMIFREFVGLDEACVFANKNGKIFNTRFLLKDRFRIESESEIGLYDYRFSDIYDEDLYGIYIDLENNLEIRQCTFMHYEINQFVYIEISEKLIFSKKFNSIFTKKMIAKELQQQGVELNTKKFLARIMDIVNCYQNFCQANKV